MLESVSEDVTGYCYRHAEECARWAALQSNERFRRDFLELERRWLSLAQSSGVAELPDRFFEAEGTDVATKRHNGETLI